MSPFPFRVPVCSVFVDPTVIADMIDPFMFAVLLARSALIGRA